MLFNIFSYKAQFYNIQNLIKFVFFFFNHSILFSIVLHM